MSFPRCSGVLLHPTSLPGRYGIGSFNASAYAWVDFLASAEQSLWQVLPLGPTSFGDSPYQSFSTYAGNPYLISLEALVEEGLLSLKDLKNHPTFPLGQVDYGALHDWKLPLLGRAAQAVTGEESEFVAFCEEHRSWLEDYALFRALKDAHGQTAWNQWSPELRQRDPEALKQAREKHAASLHAHKFMQWKFFSQWRRLKAYANRQGLKIFGDIPIFVAMDSSDAWVNPSCFYFNKKLQPTVVAGVPPDYFAVTGQLWGNPLYHWPTHKKTGYRWWIDRIRAAFNLFDVVRIDHFRGFAGYWEVPAKEKTAVKGRWVKGPGADLFKAIRKELGDLPIVAEDLGDITPDVIALRDQLGFPGMKIVQFGFGAGASNPFLVHNFTSNFVVYTGTHDNDTCRGWFEESSKPLEREHFLAYFGNPQEPASLTMMRAAMSSVAQVCVVPLQDLMDLDSKTRMNFPGRGSGNWQWRLEPDQLKENHRVALRSMTELYGRLPVRPTE